MEYARVARMAGLHPNTLYNYISGHSYPNIAVFAEICKACGVTVTIKDGEVFINETH
jgi:DNA-binding phage protein